jgi:hypothetical protein
VQRYDAVVEPNLSAVSDAAETVGNDCGGSDLATCRSAMRNMLIQLQGFKKDLDALQVPDCLKPADQELKAALDLYIQGDQDGIAAIDAGDADKLTKAADELDQGNSHFTRADTLIKQANCP